MPGFHCSIIAPRSFSAVACVIAARPAETPSKIADAHRPDRWMAEGIGLMFETIILAVCMIQTPSICKEVNISVEPDPTGSLQLPYHCARRGQLEAQKWIGENSTWRVESWACRPHGKLRFKI